MNRYYCIGWIGAMFVDHYIRAKNKVEAKKKMRKIKRFKGVKSIKCLIARG